MTGGTYTTVDFQPGITYTVPTGWDNEEDTPGNFALLPPGGDLPGINAGTSDFVGIYSTVAAPNGCKDGPAPGVGTSVAAIAERLAHDPALVVTNSRTARVGGLVGVVMDLAVSAHATPCPYSNGHPVAPYLTGVGNTGLDHNTGPGQKSRLYLLTQPAGTLAIEIVDVHGGRDLDSLASILETLAFAT